MGRVSLDRDYQATRERYRQEAKVMLRTYNGWCVAELSPQDSAGHLKSGVQGLLLGMGQGITGVLTMPFQGGLLAQCDVF